MNFLTKILLFSVSLLGLSYSLGQLVYFVPQIAFDSVGWLFSKAMMFDSFLPISDLAPLLIATFGFYALIWGWKSIIFIWDSLFVST